jgi:RHS repeat-associated protein
MREACVYDLPILHVSKTCVSKVRKFTGKERDTETGLDYFGARYYGANMGRWMSPDWAAAPTAVPYAMFGDPQTLNYYSYVRNNPLFKADLDGHGCPPDCPVMLGPFIAPMGLAAKVIEYVGSPNGSATTKGTGQILLGGALVASTLGGNPSGPAGILLLGGTAFTGTTTAVTGVVNVTGGLSGQDVSKGTNALAGMGNPGAVATTIATGDIDKGRAGGAVYALGTTAAGVVNGNLNPSNPADAARIAKTLVDAGQLGAAYAQGKPPQQQSVPSPPPPQPPPAKPEPACTTKSIC